MQKAIKDEKQKPLTLKGWVYAPDGKELSEIIKTSFLEFYFMKEKKFGKKLSDNPD